MLGGVGAIGLAGCTSDGESNTTSPKDDTTADRARTTTSTTTVTETTVDARALSALPGGACEQSNRTSETTFEDGPFIDSDTTLGADADVVLVQGGLRVASGVTLTIEPGTTLAFSRASTLSVEGTLSAAGSCSSPIVFTGIEDRTGFWGGLTFSRNSAGTLDHVLVENGGTERREAVTVHSDGNVGVTNTEVRGGGGDAVVVTQDGSLGSFSGNALAGTEGKAFRGSLHAAAALDESTVYGQASERPVVVTASEISEDETVSIGPAGVPYAVAPDGGGGIFVSGTLEIAPGSTLLFRSEGHLTMEATGELVADASSGDPITLGSLQETRGYWYGVKFFGANSSANVLHNVAVEYAGGDADGQGLLLRGESRVTVENSAFIGNDGYGIRIRQNATADVFEGNTFENNGAPIWTSGQTMRLISPDNTFSGNDDDRIHVLADEFDGHAIPEGEDHTWSDPGVPLFLEQGRSGTFGVFGSLILDQGLTLQMDQNQGVYVTGEMTTDVSFEELSEDYALTSPSEGVVTFEGEQATAGYWKGIAYDNTQSSNNKLRYCTIRHAGGARQPPATEQQEAAVMVLRGSRLQFEDVFVEQSAGYGLFAQQNNELGKIDRLAFHDSQAPMYLYADSSSVVGRNIFTDANETDQIFLESPIGATSTELFFEDPEIPFRILPSQVGTTLEIGDRMVVKDGVELRFEQDVGLVVTADGSLEVRGDTDQVTDPDTVFRGVQAQPGYWQGIRYSETTSQYNDISGTGIYHTGSAGWPYLAETADEGETRAAVAATGAAEATVENCHVAEFEGVAFLEAFTSNPLREDGVNATLTLSGNVIE